MSGYKIHFTVGLIVTLLAMVVAISYHYLTFTIQNFAWLLLIAFVFSLLPDVDIGTSLIRKVLLIAFIIFIFFNGVGLIGIILGVIIIIIQFLPHRGIMHTVIMGIFLAGLLWFFFHNWAFVVIALLNFLSHLVVDRF